MNLKQLLFAMVWIMSLAGIHAQTSTPPSSGDGSEEDPYQIATLENLYWLSQNSDYWSAHYVQTADIDASDTENWDGGKGFSRIGNDTLNFRGSYNGQGYSIKRLYINRVYEDYVALFGYANGAKIDSLGIVNCDISGGGATGGLVAIFEDGEISYCYSSGAVKGVFVGGLVATINDAKVSSCYFSGSVEDYIYDYSSDYVSAWESYTAGFFATCIGSEIKNCYCTGTVTNHTQNPISGFGIETLGSSIINNCYCANSLVTDYYDVNSFVMGAVNTNFSNCYYKSEITELEDDYATPLSDIEMQTFSSFNNWDFAGISSDGTDDVWTIITGENSGYPLLMCQLENPYSPELGVSSIEVANSTAILTCSFESMGVPNPVSYGFCYSNVNETPDVISCDTINLGPINGFEEVEEFTSEISVIDSNYFVRAFAINAIDTVYSSNIASVVIQEEPIQEEPKGDGSEEDPYQITTLENLYWLSQNSDYWSAHFIQTADIDASDTKNWDEGKGFSPIGNSSVNFTGTYNGKDHEINSLCIYRNGKDYNGLIGYAQGARIDSVKILNCIVYGAFTVSGLVANNNGSIINSCCVTGFISGELETGELVGLNNGTITNCYGMGTVSGMYGVGGLVGDNGGSISMSYSICTANAEGVVGGLVGGNYGGKIENCYSMSDVTGNEHRVGGLVGDNVGDSQVSDCYSSGRVKINDNTGGLVGSCTFGATVSNCFYKLETGEETSSYGIGLTLDQMKLSSSFETWGLDTSSVWGIREGKTFPALKTVDNAPFAFADTITNGSFTATSLLENDYDYETLQENLTVKIDSATYLDEGLDLVDYLKSIDEGDSLRMVYRAGEIRPEHNDTLWGNQMVSYLVYNSTTYTDIAYETDEDTPLYLPELTKTYLQIPFRILDYPDHGIVEIVNDSLYYFPDENFNGIDFGKVRYLELNVDLYVNFMCKVNSVNDAPEITSTAVTTVTENEAYTYTLTAIDVDGDELTYSLSNAPEGMEIDSTGLISWIPTTNITTSGEITAIVSDGELTDSEVFTVSVDSEVTTDILNTTQTEVEIYPNPVKTTFYMSGISGTGELYIYNAVGSLVKYNSSMETGSSIDVTDLPKGIYVVRLKDENGVATIKINKI